MKRFKFFALVFIVILAMSLAFTGCGAKEKLVLNGDFSSFDTEEQHMNEWTYVNNNKADDSFIDEPLYTVEDPNVDGALKIGRYVTLSISSNPSYAQMRQKVKLQKDVTYKLSAKINVESNLSGKTSKFVGAYVGFLEDPNFRELVVNEKTSGWVDKEVYFTPSSNKEMTLVVGIGIEESKAKGAAKFDNIKIERADAPLNTPIYTIKKGNDFSLSNGGSVSYVVLFAMFSLIISGFFVLLMRKFNNVGQIELKNQKASVFVSNTALFIYLILGAFLMRFIWVLVSYGNSDLISQMSKISTLLATKQPWNIYANTTTTMPVGNMYILWLIGGLSNLLNIETGSVGMAIILRMPAIIADIIVCYLIYSVASKYHNMITATLIAGLYAILPVFFTVSSIWGMFVPITVCLLFAMALFMLKKNYIGVSAFYLLALLTNNYVLILLPIVVAFYVMLIVKNQKNALGVIITIIASAIAFYLVTLPFTYKYVADSNAFFAFKKIWADFKTDNLYNQNAFNLYSIFALQNVALPTAINVLNGIFVCATAGFIVYAYVVTHNRLDLILMMSMMFAIFGNLCAKATVEFNIIALGLMLLYIAIAGDRRVLRVFNGYAFLSFLNVAELMSRSGFISNNPNASYVTIYNADAFLIFFSILSVLLTVYFIYLVVDIVLKDKKEIITQMNGSVANEFKASFAKIKAKVTRKSN
ncbi:MAG: hypothetical protein RR374_01665 [Clostridia bacterium]